MGLLTDTKQRQAVLRVITKHHGKLSILLYIGGLLWFLALAYRPLNAGTYFSENALLPGLVQSDVPYPFPELESYAQALKVEMTKNKNAVPKDWIFQQFQSLGLDTYRHNFTINYPFKMAINENLQGQNVYAILRSRRAASFEALVMTAPFRTASNSRKTPTDGSVVLMLSLASLFRKNPYWAKNIIFLLTDFEEVGVHAWLEAYHETKSPYVIPDDLGARGGAIQAAINLELPTSGVRYLNLKLEGLNGQLPNLDLFNLAVRLSNREQVPAKLHHRTDPRDQESWDGYQSTLKTMLNMMWSQASGAPSGNHGMFHRFHIEALTLEGIKAKKAPRSYDIEQVARVVEGIFRSLNNLLERFHQSFFFYLLPATDRYVSIGLYMPPFGIMVAAGLVKALALWIATHTTTEEEDKTKKSEDAAGDGEGGEKAEGGATEGGEHAAETENKSKDEQTEGKGDSSPLLRRRAPPGRGGSEGKSPKDSDTEVKDKGEVKEEVDESLSADDLDLDDLDIEQETAPSTGLLSVLPVILMAYLLGLLAYTAPNIMTRFSPPVQMKALDTVFYGILAVFTAGLAYPYLMNRKVSVAEERIGGDWRLVKCVGLIVQGLMLLAMALINISLAFFLAAVSLPISMAVQPTSSKVLGALQLLVLVVVSPMGLLYVAAVVNTALEHPAYPVLDVLWQAIESAKYMTSLLLVDRYLFDSWTYTLGSFGFLPTWLLLWAVPFSTPTV